MIQTQKSTKTNLAAAFLMILGTGLLPAVSQAQVSCSTVLSVDKDLLRMGGRYRVQFASDPTMRTLKFEGLVKDDQSTLVEFSEGSGGKIKTYRVRQDEVADWRKFQAFDLSFLKRPILFLTFQALQAHAMALFTFKPYRALAKTEAVEVVGDWSSSAPRGQEIAEHLKVYDDLMMSMGFQRPPQTRIVLAGQPILPNMLGPFSERYPTLNVWTGRSSPVIAMQPILWHTRIVQDDSVLFHERTHSLLHRTYNEKSYINKSAAVQEAIADFASSHMRGSPEIVPGFSGPNAALRNIESREADETGKVEARKKILDIVSNEDHDNSLMVSHILWTLRQAVGAEAMNHLLKPILDNLNAHYDSYEELLNKEGRTTRDSRQSVAYDLEFILATLWKTSSQGPSAAYEDAIKNTVRECADEIHFSVDRLNEVSLHLSASQENFAYVSKSEIMQMMIARAYGVGGVVIDASLLLWFGHAL